MLNQIVNRLQGQVRIRVETQIGRASCRERV